MTFQKRLIPLAAAVLAALPASAQDGHYNVARAREILRDTVQAVERNYYDPTLHGIDLDSREKVAEANLAKLDSFSAAFGNIAWVLEPLHDSHTMFIPPRHPYHVEKGWVIAPIGSQCFITAVKPGSDAAAQGLKPGDEVLGWNGFQVKPDNLWQLKYSFTILAPHAVHELVVKSAGERPRKLAIKIEYVPTERILTAGVEPDREDNLDLLRTRFVECGEDTLVARFPKFENAYSQSEELFEKAEHYKTLILDLRGNSGGAEDGLLRMLGHLFAHPVKVGQVITRKGTKALTVKPRGPRFDGNLIVMIDGESASAAEIFARVVQLEKRGTVIGDRSAGMVMRAEAFGMLEGEGTTMLAGVDVTVANLVLSDGTSLEHHPVLPDEIILPTQQDLAKGRDPVLTRAAQLAGLTDLNPQKAGELFPYQWKKL